MRYQSHFQFCEWLSFQLEATSEVAGLLWPHRTSSPGGGVWLLCGQEELGVHLHHRWGRVSIETLSFFSSTSKILWCGATVSHFISLNQLILVSMNLRYLPTSWYNIVLNSWKLYVLLHKTLNPSKWNPDLCLSIIHLFKSQISYQWSLKNISCIKIQ